MDLNTTWFALVGVLIIGYAILDGFDFGVGVLHLFARNEEERQTYLNAIGPVWDGNEVWLLTGGGALFAAFPVVYATVFSGFYLAFMLLLTALIVRAVSMEFRGKVDSPTWKNFWDWAFGLGSLLPAVLLGVAFGNILRGIPIDGAGTFTGSFLGLLNPYSVLIGVLSLVLFVMHGATYLTLKTDGELLLKAKTWASKAWIVFAALYSVATFWTIFEAPFLFEGLLGNVISWVLMLSLLASLVAFPIFTHGSKHWYSFLASSVTIGTAIGLAALSLYPRLVPSSTDLLYSLTIYNASSTENTLTAMLIIALIGMPIVIGYTVFIYRVFKGKVVFTKESY